MGQKIIKESRLDNGKWVLVDAKNNILTAEIDELYDVEKDVSQNKVARIEDMLILINDNLCVEDFYFINPKINEKASVIFNNYSDTYWFKDHRFIDIRNNICKTLEYNPHLIKDVRQLFLSDDTSRKMIHKSLMKGIERIANRKKPILGAIKPKDFAKEIKKYVDKCLIKFNQTSNEYDNDKRSKLLGELKAMKPNIKINIKAELPEQIVEA